MASSSVSQESIDIEDYDLYARRSRIRTMRGRTTSGQHKTEYHESMESGDHRDGKEDDPVDDDTNGVVGVTGDHESPTRVASRLKDKRIVRPTHLHKPKTAKDKRKLREKRRSTGVVHLQQPSTESTGDSLDEDEVRKNTQYNEFIDADNPQTPEEERKAFPSRNVRNKSPSDLEADLEDNQDYDSTVSQSETNLTTLGEVPNQATNNSSSTNSNHVCAKTNNTQPTTPPKSSATTTTITHHKPHQQNCTSQAQAIATSSRPPPVFTKEKTPPVLPRNIPERLGSQPLLSSSTPSSSVPVPTRTSQNSQVRWKESSSADIEMRRRHKVHWQTSEGSTSPSNNSNTAGSVEELDISTRLRELEQVLSRERQERLREKEERQKLRELLYEREKTIEHLQKEISLLHQDLENLDLENIQLRRENKTLLTALNNRSASHFNRHT